MASPRMMGLARRVAAHPWPTVALALLVTLAALIPLQGLDTSTSIEDYLPPTAEVAAGREAHSEFPLASTVVTLAESKTGNLLDRESLAELAALEVHLAADPELQKWLYNTSRPITSPGGLVAGTLAAQGYNLTTPPRAPEGLLQEVLGQLIGDPLTAGLFGRATNASGSWQAASVVVAVQLDKGAAYNDEESELTVRSAVHTFAAQQLTLHTMAAPSKAMEEASQKTLSRLLPVSLLLMALLLYLALRRVSDVLLSLVAVIMALTWMFGAGELLGLGFSQYSFIAPILVLALGVDDALHILHRYRSEYSRPAAEGEVVPGDGKGGAGANGPQRAITVSVGMVGTALLLTSLTTMAAFGANRASQVLAIRDFGTHVALGIGAAFVLTTTFLPAARLLLDRWLKPELEELERSHWATPWLERLAAGAFRRWPAVVAAVLLLTAGSLAAATTLEQELEMVELVEPESEIYLAFRTYERDFRTTSGEEAALLVEGDKLARPEVLEGLLAAQARMADDAKVAQLHGRPRALSIADYVRAALEATGGLLPGPDNQSVEVVAYNATTLLPTEADGTLAVMDWLLANGLGEVTPLEMQALARKDESGNYNGLLILVVSADIGTLGGQELLSELRGDAGELEGLGLRVRPLGQPIERYQMLSTMTEGMLRSVVISIGLCLLLLVVLRRSVREGLEAILPVVLVAVWVYGTIWALGWALNVVTVSIAAITIGVGVDYAVHLLHRYREARAEGTAPEPAMAEAVRHAGTPLLGATLTTMAGFGVLYFSPMAIFSQFGLLTALMVVYSLVAALVLLPVVVLGGQRMRKAAEEPSTPAQ